MNHVFYPGFCFDTIDSLAVALVRCGAEAKAWRSPFRWRETNHERTGNARALARRNRRSDADG